MNWRNVFTVYAKELRDTLRDRRAIVSMFVVPTIVIPALMFGFGAVAMKTMRKTGQEVASIMIVGGENSPQARASIEKSARLRLVPFAEDYAARIGDKRLRAAVEIPRDFDAAVAAGEVAAVTVYTHDGELRSGFATSEIERILREHREKIVRERLDARGLPAEFVRPFEIRRQNVAAPERVGGNAFGGLVPYLLILLSFVGAMYPAMDLTAGEKERGTMETILCSPVARIELVLGKFLLVMTASLATVVSSLFSLLLNLGVAAPLLFKSVDEAMRGVGGLPTLSVPGLFGVVVLVLPLAVLFSALLLTISLCAKSYKEAQTYVSPLIFVVVLPAIGALLPGVELNAKLALVPILNVALASKEMVGGNFPAGLVALIFFSTSIYAAAALAFAVRMFEREDVIFRT
jgi:sodium transport system permease protein